jgi:hypothetical protein
MPNLSACEAFVGISPLILKGITLGVTKYAASFPKRSQPWLFTNAALGGLKPAPASRLRGANPHLLCSYAHFIEKRARGALY